MASTILITGCTLLSGAGGPLLPDRWLAVEGKTVAGLGAMADCPDPGTFDLVLEAGASLLLPGLVNGHNHSAMTLFRGFADDLGLDDWLHHHIFPAEAAHVDAEMVYWCAKLAAAEMIAAGTTCVADAYFHSAHAARAFAEAGLRAVVGHGIVDFPVPSVPDPKDNVAVVARFIDQWQGVDPLIRPAVFAHSPYTCGSDTLVAAKRLADDRGVRFFIHVAETRAEYRSIIDPRGSSPVRHLDALGLLDDNCTLVHAVWVDADDIDILAARGTAVITCPQSNAKLGSGIAPVTAMRQAGITVGLGTDGCASNNGLDLFREMDLLAKIHKVSRADATAMGAAEVLACATAAGAAALGLDRIGRIEPGWAADLVLLDLDRPHLTPFYNEDLLVYSASGSDVDSVIVGGRLIMRQRVILSFDVGEAMARVASLAGAVARQRSLIPRSAPREPAP